MMQYKIFRIPCAADSEEEENLNKFLRTIQPLTVHRDFVENGSRSFTLFTVEYLFHTQQQEKGMQKKGKVDYREVLCTEDFNVFSRLREWRKETAAKEAVAVYTLFTNEQLSQIAVHKPESKTALQSIPGIGEAKINKYGQSVLDCLATISGQQTDMSVVE
jgi:superfamily II DNA helicase RecQ